MARLAKFRWQDLVNLVVAVWLVLSPWSLGYADAFTLAAYSAVAAGLVIMTVESIDLETPGAWEEWIALVVGLWLIASPLVLGFGAHRAGMVSTVAVGVVVTVLSAWSLWETGPPSNRVTGY